MGCGQRRAEDTERRRMLSKGHKYTLQKKTSKKQQKTNKKTNIH